MASKDIDNVRLAGLQELFPNIPKKGRELNDLEAAQAHLELVMEETMEGYGIERRVIEMTKANIQNTFGGKYEAWRLWRNGWDRDQAAALPGIAVDKKRPWNMPGIKKEQAADFIGRVYWITVVGEAIEDRVRRGMEIDDERVEQIKQKLLHPEQEYTEAPLEEQWATPRVGNELGEVFREAPMIWDEPVTPPPPMPPWEQAPPERYEEPKKEAMGARENYPGQVVVERLRPMLGEGVKAEDTEAVVAALMIVLANGITDKGEMLRLRDGLIERAKTYGKGRGWFVSDIVRHTVGRDRVYKPENVAGFQTEAETKIDADMNEALIRVWKEKPAKPGEEDLRRLSDSLTAKRNLVNCALPVTAVDSEWGILGVCVDAPGEQITYHGQKAWALLIGREGGYRYVLDPISGHVVKYDETRFFRWNQGQMTASVTIDAGR